MNNFIWQLVTSTAADDRRRVQHRHRHLLGQHGRHQHVERGGHGLPGGGQQRDDQLHSGDRGHGRQGVDLTSNTGSTISFTGTLTFSSGSNTAFNATGGGTVTATDTASTLTTTTGTALNVANTTIGAGGLKFASVSAGTAASGPASGIVLNNTGASGSLTVNGGTIQKTTSHGVSLTGTLSPAFNAVTIKNTGAAASTERP